MYQQKKNIYMNKKHFTILGNITFLESPIDGIDAAIIENLISFKMLTEDEAEECIGNPENGVDCYLIPELYKGSFQFNDNNWTCTDLSTFQFRKNISEKEFYFMELRVHNPLTKKMYVHEANIDLNDYTINQMIDACSAYGYDAEMVTNWFNNNVRLDLIAECIFENDFDNL